MSLTKRHSNSVFEDIVLDKNIFSELFDKDIRRVFVFRKCERIAKAIVLIGPAFKDNKPLHERAERLSMELVDGAALPIREGKEQITRVLLSLASLIELARFSGTLSSMNADMVLREVRNLVSDILEYDEPRITLPEMPGMAKMNKSISIQEKENENSFKRTDQPYKSVGQSENIKETKPTRREAILDVLKAKETVYIKDISSLIRDVSEKTIQRELQALVLEGIVRREGERRWTTYRLATL